MSKKLMNLADLCERLQCKESWARTQLESRRWPITWVAKSYRFSESDYERILQILSEPPASERRRGRHRPTRSKPTLGSKRPLTA